MAPRSTGSTTIVLGLVSIPVKLYPATSEPEGVSFNLLHSRCGSRLKQQYVCAADGEKVEREQMVKGYEVAKDQFVTFSAEELKALDAVPSEEVKIVEFVALEKVDAVYFDKLSYLGPDAGSGRAYRLLTEALASTRTGALAQHAARGKQHLVMLRASGGRLVMQQLRRAEEVRDASEIAVSLDAPTPGEMALAVKLVEHLGADAFEPGKYLDEVRARTLELVQQKVAGKEIVAAPPAAGKPAQIIDLLEALKASLELGEQRRGPKRAARSEPRPAKRAVR